MSDVSSPPVVAAPKPPSRLSSPVPKAIAGGVAAVLLIGALLYWRAASSTNQVKLADEPKRVTVVEAMGTTFRPDRRYVGTIEPWVSAKIGPQLISAYVDTVLVRPGSVVQRGEVVATLDCRNASATSKAVSMQARAVEATQAALANESTRVTSLLDGGFVSPNEAEQKSAESVSKQAQVLALQAQMLGTSLQVADCVLRAPFDGEVAERTADPGAFVRPGSAIATLVDRRTVRVTADVPEEDFEAVAPGIAVRLHFLATGKDTHGVIARRAPAADADTRTAHIEIDLPDPERNIPVGTTAEVSLDVGDPKPVTEIPLSAAVVRGPKASVFVIAENVAHVATAIVVGERNGRLYLDPSFPSGSRVVPEGRGGLGDGDRVSAQDQPRIAAEKPDPKGTPQVTP